MKERYMVERKKIQLSKIYLRRVQCLTSSSLATVSLHCGIRLTKLDVVGLLKSSRTSRTKSGAEMGATPGMMKSNSDCNLGHADIGDDFSLFSTISSSSDNIVCCTRSFPTLRDKANDDLTSC